MKKNLFFQNIPINTICIIAFCLLINNFAFGQNYAISKAKFSEIELNKINKIIETNKIFNSVEYNLSDVVKQDFKDFFTTNNVNAKIASKIIGLACIPFQQTISIQDRILICDYLLFLYKTNDSFFPTSIISAERLRLQTLSSTVK